MSFGQAKSIVIIPEILPYWLLWLDKQHVLLIVIYGYKNVIQLQESAQQDPLYESILNQYVNQIGLSNLKCWGLHDQYKKPLDAVCLICGSISFMTPWKTALSKNWCLYMTTTHQVSRRLPIFTNEVCWERLKHINCGGPKTFQFSFGSANIPSYSPIETTIRRRTGDFLCKTISYTSLLSCIVSWDQ